MKLIADSGSTKTDWALVAKDGRVIDVYKTQGINPFHLEDSDINKILTEELGMKENPQEVFFYGSGVTSAMQPRMETLLAERFPQAKVSAGSDLMGAARAVLGRNAGIACILGTGANSCLYDGKNILLNTPPLGYILGDEGSGAYIGKRFFNGIFKGSLPVSLRDKYYAWSGMDYATIINKVYRQPLANRFLASLSPFVSMSIERGHAVDATEEERYESRALEEMLEDSFEQFFRLNIQPYVEKAKGEPQVYGSPLRIAFVGSIASCYHQSLEKVFQKKHHFILSSVQKAPLEGLVRFHS